MGSASHHREHSGLIFIGFFIKEEKMTIASSLQISRLPPENRGGEAGFEEQEGGVPKG